MRQRASPLAGFWMGGYEGADHVNRQGQALDMAQASGHIDRLDEDHRRAAQAGLQGVRESIGWRLAEAPGGAIDLSRALRIQASARRHGLQPVWTLMHYGLPGDLSVHDDAMVPRLVRFAREVARVLRKGSERAPVYNVINEISFLAWAAANSELMAPPNGPPSAEELATDPGLARTRSSGYDIKRRLARAALLAMRAMRDEDPRARFLNVEPLVHLVAPDGRPDLQAQAALERGWQWQAFDMLAGRVEPELGGGPEWLDLVGVNYYHRGQWEVQSGALLEWHERDPRRLPLHRLLHEVWQRYPGPLVLAETSHVGIGRAAWLHEVAAEIRTAQRQGVPVLGLCLYPLVDRPDWQQPSEWHRSGIWHVDVVPVASGQPHRVGRRDHRALQRHAEPAVHAALRQWQHHLPRRREGSAGSEEDARGPQPPALVAYAPQGWRAGHPRSQQWLARLVAGQPGRRVVVVDADGATHPSPHGRWLDHQPDGPMVDLLVLHGFGAIGAEGCARDMAAALCGWLMAQGLGRHVAWIDTPAARPLAEALGPQHLTEALADAPHRRLPLRVNGAFFRRGAARTGGWARFEARALTPPGPGPVLGYAGPIDARLDRGLLAELANARRNWQWVLIGPLRGIGAEDLPRAPNLHWLGEQAYELLPALMSQWQLCVLPRRADVEHPEGVMPSAMGEALAAGLTVVTSLPLAPAWSRLAVQGAADGADFIAACERVLAAPPDLRAPRKAPGRSALRVLERTRQPHAERVRERARAWERSIADADILMHDVMGVIEPAMAEEQP